MNTELILEAAHATRAGTALFPEIVAKLLTAGVEYYHVDYVGLRKSFYGAGGDVVATPITFEGLPPVAAEFDSGALRAAIPDSQQNGQKFRDFSAVRWPPACRGILHFCVASVLPTSAVRGISIRSGFRGLRSDVFEELRT